MGLSVDSGWTTRSAPQVLSLKTLLSTHLVGRGAPWKLAVKYLGRVAPTLSPFFETSEVKNESSEALLMSQMKSSIKLETKIRPQKLIFLMQNTRGALMRL